MSKELTELERELLEAMKECLEWIDNWSPEFTEDEEWPECERAIRAAIAKAESRWNEAARFGAGASTRQDGRDDKRE